MRYALYDTYETDGECELYVMTRIVYDTAKVVTK